jgi:hypothetical protein
VKRLAVGLLTAFALAALAAAPVAAKSVDGATYRRLVAAAVRDPGALAQLRAVTAVDGRPVDIRRVLEGTPARVRARLGALRTGPQAAGDAAGARRTAAAILAGADYRPERAGIVSRFLSWLAGLLSIPDGAGGAVRLIVLGGVIAAVAGLTALLLGTVRQAKRRERSLRWAAGAFGVGSATPEELERRAAAAEAEGRLEEAMRLQLAAALTRLDAAGTIRVRRDTTLGQVARSLRSDDFDVAADRFAGVVYGRRPPTPEDAAVLRERLAATLVEAGRT